MALFIRAPHGRLEAIFRAGADPPAGAAVICHPHPLHGGTMHNKVVFHAAKALKGLGWTTLRFNFRGVGRSTGDFAEGRGEREDVEAALDHLAERIERAPLALVGFSFGAWVGLRVAARDDRVTVLMGLGTPFDRGNWGFLTESPKAKLFIHAEDDQVVPVQYLEELYPSFAEPKLKAIIKGTDHFFTDHLDLLRDTIQAYFHHLDLPRR